MADELQDTLPDPEGLADDLPAEKPEEKEPDEAEGKGEEEAKTEEEEELAPEDAEKQALDILAQVNPERAAEIQAFLDDKAKAAEAAKAEPEADDDMDEVAAEQKSNFMIVESRADEAAQQDHNAYWEAHDNYVALKQHFDEYQARSQDPEAVVDPEALGVLHKNAMGAYDALIAAKAKANGTAQRSNFVKAIRRETESYLPFEQYQTLYMTLRAGGHITNTMAFAQRRAVLNQALAAYGRKPVGVTKAKAAEKKATIRAQLKKLGGAKMTGQKTAAGRKVAGGGGKAGGNPKWQTKDPDMLRVLNSDWD